MNKNRMSKSFFAVVIGCLCNAVLFGVKLWIGLVGNNIAVLTDAFNNMGDVVSCILSALCFYLLARNKHYKKFPHGIGRLESVFSLVLSLIVIVVGAYFFIAATNRLLFSTPVTFKMTHFLILLFTVLVKIGMAIFYRLANKKHPSDILRCCFFDSVLDASFTFMTVIGLLLNKYIQLRLDAFFGMAISIMMVISGIKIILTEGKILLGTLPDEKTVEEITALCKENPLIEEVLGIDYHDYGEEKYFYVRAVFTNREKYDIIYTSVNEFAADLEKKLKIKIKFIL